MMKADGGQVMAQLGNTLEDHNVRTFVLPRRFLRVKATTAIVPGEIVIDAGRKYLLLDHSEKNRAQTRVFKLCEINKQVRWKRAVAQEDLVTGLKRQDQLEDKGMIDVAWELVEPLFDSDKRKNMSFRVLTGQPIAARDTLDGAVVHYAELIQGIYYAEAS